MNHRLINSLALFAAVWVLCVMVCFGDVAMAQDITYDLVPCELDNKEQCIEITLPCLEPEVYGLAAVYNRPCTIEKIQIPNGRPIYAFLVNGFDQNHNFDMFHFYNFAQCIFREGLGSGEKAYVHFAWWNNLLAPYMEKPLHNSSSLPGMGALNAIHDYFLFPYDPDHVPTKAIPAEDYQFQKDAKAVLAVIRTENPNAKIILVGHSMGGDAVIRLADSMPEDFVIDLLAPIDPVGNRTCLPNKPSVAPVDMSWENTWCEGAYNFTRFQATHTDWYWYPYRISFEDKNIGYLYHRWQTEFMFPFDYGCPDTSILCPLQFHMLDEPDDERILPDAYLFRHNEPRRSDIDQGSTNVQSRVSTSFWSGTVVYPNLYWFYNWGGGQDGHGEIVGFRALWHRDMTQSIPLALKAQGDWPSRDKEQDPNDINDPIRRNRILHLKAWEANSDYLEYYHGPPGGQGIPFMPKDPDLCLVSDDLCSILENTSVNQPPVADANGPYESECEGTTTTISLDGTGSSDPESTNLSYFWHTDCPGVNPGEPTNSFDDPTSAKPLLTVDTSNGCAVECIVELTVTDDSGNEDFATASVSIGDTVSPGISCPTDTTIECDEPTDPSKTGFATVTDECDLNPAVTFSDVTIPGNCQQEATIERTWSATDYCGNTSSCVQTIEVVDTTPPVISSVSASPEILWPPNHQMRLIVVEAVAIDNCDPEPACKIISVTSNEPIDGKGDGNTTPDWEITGDLNLKLRAERAGGKIGREYTITVECTDDCNNSATVETIVTVSHDSGKKKNNKK